MGGCVEQQHVHLNLLGLLVMCEIEWMCLDNILARMRGCVKTSVEVIMERSCCGGRGRDKVSNGEAKSKC